MPSNLTAKFDDEGAREARKKLRKYIPIAIEFAFKSHGSAFEAEMDKRFTGTLSGPLRRNASLDKLVNRTNRLHNSIGSRFRQTRDGARLIVSAGGGVTSSYVRIQEKGGTIRPKRAKYLTIPMPANITQAGRTRKTSPRSFPDGFFFKKNGNLYFGRRLENGSVQTLFALKKEVKIPPRLGFEKTWKSREMKRDRDERIDKGLRQAFRIAGVAKP